MTPIFHIVISIPMGILSIISILIIHQLFIHLCCSTPQLNSDKSLPSATKSASGSNPNPITTTQQQYSIPSFFRYTASTCSLLFCFTIISVCFDRITLILNPTDTKTFWWIGIIVWSLYFIGRMILSLIFIGRLHYTFIGTTFEYSKCTVNTLISTWSLMPLFAILSMIIILISIIGGLICGICFILTDIVLSCTLLYLYLKKLFTLNGTSRNQMLTALMTRYALLYSICFISTFLVFMALSMVMVVIEPSGDVQSDIWCLVAIDSLIGMLCLWLTFPFSQKWYQRLCGCFDIKCQICCMYMTKSRQTKDEKFVMKEVEKSPTDKQERTETVITIKTETLGNSAIIL